MKTKIILETVAELRSASPSSPRQKGDESPSLPTGCKLKLISEIRPQYQGMDPVPPAAVPHAVRLVDLADSFVFEMALSKFLSESSRLIGLPPFEP